MQLEGISANFLGDSITEAWGIEHPFHQILAETYRMKVARNYGVGGTRIARRTVPSDCPTHDRSFCDRFPDMDDDAELIVVFGGTNDFGHGDAPLGEPSDRSTYTFWGACHYLFEGLLCKYPASRIVVMTPLHRTNEDNIRGDGDKTENLAALYEYVCILRQAAEYYSLPIIDLWANSGIQPKVDIIRDTYTRDGLHPNEVGHARLAAYIGQCLEKL